MKSPRLPCCPFTSNLLIHLMMNIPCSVQDSQANRNKILYVLLPFGFHSEKMLQTQEMLLLLDCKRAGRQLGKFFEMWVPVQNVAQKSLFSHEDTEVLVDCSSLRWSQVLKSLRQLWGCLWPHAFEPGQSILLPKRGRIGGARAFAFKRLPIILKRILDQSQASGFSHELAVWA